LTVTQIARITLIFEANKTGRDATDFSEIRGICVIRVTYSRQ